MELTEASNLTLGQWLDKWLMDYMALTLRESTLIRYKGMIEHQIKPYLGKKKSVLSPPPTSKSYTTGSGKMVGWKSITRKEMPCPTAWYAVFT